MKEKTTFAAVVLECLEEQFGIASNAENSSALGYD
jgi:hypothetical protein